MDDRLKRQFKFSGGYWLLAFAGLLLLQSFVLEGMGPKVVGYDEFLKTLREGKLAKVELRQSEIVAELKGEGGRGGAQIVASRLPGIDESALLDELKERGTPFAGRIEKTSWVESFLLGWVIPLAIRRPSISTR